MAKQFRRKLLFITIFLSILLSYSAYASLIPSVRAAEPNIQDKTMAILNDVVGLNTEEYATSLYSQLDNQYLSLPQKEADITLASDRGKLRVSCSFVNNRLRQIYLSDYEGELSVEQPAANTVEMAKGLLERYQTYGGNSFYGELASMLDNVDVTKNTTKSAGNIKLEVLNSDQTILDYVWTYTDENGIVAKSKNVILSYDRGQLKVFLNNWPLYKVVGTPKISGEEATAIALEASKNFSYEVDTDNGTSTVTGFKIAPESLGHATLSYLNFPNQSLARGGDPFTLYPSWYVPLGFDKSYLGGVTGMTVSIWADTGEVSIMGPMVIGIPSATSADEEASAISTDEEVITDGFNQTPTVLSAPIVITALFGVVGVALVSGKKVKFAGSRKLFPRFWGTLLCGIILVSVILVATPTVAASPTIPNSKARIYAAFNSDPPQFDDEIEAATWVCGQIDDAFEASGYSSSNMAGTDTTKSKVYYYAENDEQNYDRVAVFHFGHMAVGFNLGYQDNNADNITASDLDSHISSHKYVFVFIWVCAQAQYHDSGMPAAWTQRTDMSDDGYLHPDEGGQCYIGFSGISPIISGYHQTFEEQMTGPVKNFIKYFYDYALRHSYAVRDALNKATLDFFGDTFTSSILNQGYHAWWPGGVPGLPGKGYISGKMRVFGNGAIWVFQPKITFTTNPPGLSPTFYIDGEPHSTGESIHVWAPKMYTISVDDVPGYEFDYFTYDDGGWGRPATLQLLHDGEFKAHYSILPTQYSLTISAGSGGTTSPSPGTYWYDAGTPVSVTANAYTNYVFDHWILDGGYYTQNPITVTMNSNHNLQAYFTYVPPPIYHQLTVLAYNQYGYPGAVPLYIDGQYVGTTMNTYTVSQGNHQIYVASPLYEGYWVHVFQYYYYGGTYNYNNPMTLSVTSDMTLIAYYYSYYY